MGDRGPIGVVVLVATAALATVLGTVRWLDTRGLRITETTCAWDAERGGYVATLTVENRDALYKLVQATVQGRFRPPEGRDWPHRRIKTQYEAFTQPVQLIVNPHATATAGTVFTIPGVENFRCETRAKIVGQERFREPPDQAVVDAVSQTGQGQAPRRLPGRRRMGF